MYSAELEKHQLIIPDDLRHFWRRGLKYRMISLEGIHESGDEFASAGFDWISLRIIEGDLPMFRNLAQHCDEGSDERRVYEQGLPLSYREPQLVLDPRGGISHVHSANLLMPPVAHSLAEFLEHWLESGCFSSHGVDGGQAINFWMVYFARGAPHSPQLVLSKDLDLAGSADDARKAARALGLQFKPINARKAAVRLNAVLLSEDASLRIDFLPGSPPNTDTDVQEAAVSLPTKWGSVRVMHPLHCLRSRVYNVLEAHVEGEKKYDNERGLAQMRASREILDQFLDELIETEKGPRKVLKIQEVLFSFSDGPTMECEEPE